MGWRDRLTSLAEDRLGIAVLPAEQATALKESALEFDLFKEEASELAYWSLDYFSGRPQGLRREKRNRLAQRSRIALIRDPLAGAEANHLANFGFGKGVGRPTADEDDVQRVIDAAWRAAEEKLTGFEAQRHRSHQLISDANLFPVAYVRNGQVAPGFLNADRVIDIITDPEDDERPLWYVYDEPPTTEYDFENDRWRIQGEGTRGQLMGQRRLRYYAHWRNVEQVRAEAAANGEPPPPEPPPGKQGEGVVYHVRINRIGRTQFGTPPWARTLRFMSAMNQVVDAHVKMAEARSSIIAKRVVRGTPETVAKTASSILSQTGELGASRFGDGDAPFDMLRRGELPVSAANFLVENESHRLESIQLQSGAAEAQMTTSIIRGQAAAPSGFGQHYLGNAADASLATATSLELPTLMTVQAWQETFEQLFRWYTDMAIQTAVRAGVLGGDGVVPEIGQSLAELRLYDAAGFAEAQRRTRRSLRYKFSMPYPGRRNLPDVVTLVTTVVAAFDPLMQNGELRRQLLLWLATHGMQVDDPSAWVDLVLPERLARQMAQSAVAAQAAAAALGQPAGAQGQGDPSVSPQNGELPRNSPVSALQQALMEMDAEARDLFFGQVMLPLLVGAGGGANGNGSGAGG